VGAAHSTIRRYAVGALAALLIALAAPGVAAGAGAHGKQDLSGTWTTQDGQTWIFTGDGKGGYSATYHGTGTHSKLVGTVSATFDGSTLTGSDHVEEPNQVQGGAATISEYTLSFDLRGRAVVVLAGDIVGAQGTYPTTLTCQSGPCTKPPCSFVRAGEQKATKQEAAIYDDLDFLLSSRLPDASDCSVGLGSGSQSTTGSLSADALSGNLDNFKRSLGREFPDAPVAVRDKVAKAALVVQVLSAITVDGQPAFPAVQSLANSPAFALVAGAALKPPGNSKAADALRTLIRLVALKDAVAGAPKP